MHKRIERDHSGVVALLPEEAEDMWHIYNLIAVGDQIRASTVRYAPALGGGARAFGLDVTADDSRRALGSPGTGRRQPTAASTQRARPGRSTAAACA